MPKLIGLCGRARAGKDTVADYLVNSGDDFTKFSFAEPLKRAASAVFGLNSEQLYGYEKETIDRFWGMSPREILQRFGTDAMRNEFGGDIWVKALFRQARHALDHGLSVVISDVRFDNEALAIKDWGGEVWLIDRPGVEEVRSHISEAGINTRFIDRVISNEGSLDSLYKNVRLAA